MKRIDFHDYFILAFTILLFYFIQSSVSTSLCPDASSCNCTLTSGTNLDIVCSSTPTLTELPVLSDPTLQPGITQLSVSSLTVGNPGPLTRLPTNLCSAYPNIAILDLSSNAITGSLNTSELNCLSTTLTNIYFSNNNINYLDLNFLKINNKIQSMDFSHNNLTSMPSINSDTFVNFPITVVSMNFSYNLITNVDLWPLFAKTQKYMAIDMSNNFIQNFTNIVPIYVKQFTETPDPRSFFLSNNQIERISDILLEQYGACTTLSETSTAYFIIGISNLLLTNNPLICDCDSYYLVQFIQQSISDFPTLTDDTALLSRANCTAPSLTVGQQYIFSNFSAGGACANHTLPNRTNIFCSVYTNSTDVTLEPPTYWTTATTVITTTMNINNTTGNTAGTDGSSGTSSGSSSPAWYIILGIVLGLAFIVFLLVFGGYIYRDRLFPRKYDVKLSKNVSNASDYQGWGNPEQETQTCFQIDRTKPPNGVTRDPRKLRKPQNFQNSYRERKLSTSASASTEVATSTTNIVKGIPIPSKINKLPSIPSTSKDAAASTSTSQLNVIPIPLTPSKRAKLLPQVKSGIYVDSINTNLLNTSASALIANQRQRRRSSMWFHRQQQNSITPLPSRPRSMTTPKTVFDQDDALSDELPSIPTVEASKNRPPKPLRALPLLNITVMPGWVESNSNEK